MWSRESKCEAVVEGGAIRPRIESWTLVSNSLGQQSESSRSVPTKVNGWYSLKANKPIHAGTLKVAGPTTVKQRNQAANYGVNATVRPVTPLATSASVAPVRPARYAVR